MKLIYGKMIALVLVLIAFAASAQEPDPLHGDFTSKPSLVWRFAVTAPVYASPVMEDGAVYFGVLDSIFYALDIATGKPLWRFKTQGAIRSTALLSAGRIYFLSGDGLLYCLDKSGKKVWAAFLGPEKQYDFADYHQSSPVLWGRTLYIGSGNGCVYALQAADGTLLWKYQTGGVVHGTPAVDSSRVYVGSFDGYVYALGIADGALQWKFKTVGHRYFPAGEVQGSPTLSGGLVIIGARDYNVYALDAEKGFCHWNKAFTRGWVLSNTVKDSMLLMAGADERILSALDPRNGREYWKRDMEFLMFGKPAFSQTMLYIGTTIGKLHAVDRTSGEEVWTFATEGYANNRLKYFKEDDTYRDDIYSIIKSNEHFLEVEMELGGIFSTPAIDGESIVFTSTEGAVYCLKAIQ